MIYTIGKYEQYKNFLIKNLRQSRICRFRPELVRAKKRKVKTVGIIDKVGFETLKVSPIKQDPSIYKSLYDVL